MKDFNKAFKAISTVALVAAASTAQAGMVKLYGQVNRAALMADDGVDSKTTFIDNETSSSRAGVEFTGEYGRDWNYGGQVELEFYSNNSADISASNQVADRSGSDLGIRKLDYHFGFRDMFKVSLGHGCTASDYVAEYSYSGADSTTGADGTISRSRVSDIGSSYLFRNEDTDAMSSITVGSVFSNLDGLGRQDRVRVDSGEWMGFKLSASVANVTDTENGYDTALSFNREYMGMQMKLGVAYYKLESTYKGYTTSAALKHEDTGLNASVAYGNLKYKLDDHDKDYMYAQLGYSADLTGMGLTNFVVDYFNGSDMDTTAVANTDSESKSWGLGVVQSYDKMNLEVYLGYRNFEFDDNAAGAADYHDIGTFTLGFKYKFNAML